MHSLSGCQALLHAQEPDVCRQWARFIGLLPLSASQVCVKYGQCLTRLTYSSRLSSSESSASAEK